MRSPTCVTAFAALLAASVLAACADEPIPTSASHPGTLDSPLAESVRSAEASRVRMERLARRVAKAMKDADFRAEVQRSIARSGFAEQKVHLGRFLRGANGRVLDILARLNREPDTLVQADLTLAPALELYFPVEAHRQRWAGDERVLVATALADGDTPIAFDLDGRRHRLDPNTPPDTPVLAIVPQETDFDAPQAAHCTMETCGTGSGASSSELPPGLHMTRAHFNETFEGWLKGSPEFEIHVLGQVGTSSSMTTYQCIGERSSTWYRFNQNSRDWSGRVLLFSQYQLSNYKKQHPGQSLRLFVVEDDDTGCVIKTDPDRFRTLLERINAAYGDWTAGTDSLAGVMRYWTAAKSGWSVLSAIASFIKTNDELVGNAVEASVVGGYYGGANWVVKGENNVTNGWLTLEMR